MSEQSKKEAEFERLLTGYQKEGTTPKDINVGKVIEELQAREAHKVVEVMATILVKTHRYLDDIASLEAAFDESNFHTLWESMPSNDNREQFRVMRNSIRSLADKLDGIDAIIHFREM